MSKSVLVECLLQRTWEDKYFAAVCQHFFPLGHESIALELSIELPRAWSSPSSSSGGSHSVLGPSPGDDDDDDALC